MKRDIEYYILLVQGALKDQGQEYSMMAEGNYQENLNNIFRLLIATWEKDKKYFEGMGQVFNTKLHLQISKNYFSHIARTLVERGFLLKHKQKFIFHPFEYCLQMIEGVAFWNLAVDSIIRREHLFKKKCEQGGIVEYEILLALEFMILKKFGGRKEDLLKKMAMGKMANLKALGIDRLKKVELYFQLLMKGKGALLSLDEIWSGIEDTIEEINLYREKFYEAEFLKAQKRERGPGKKQKVKRGRSFKADENYREESQFYEEFIKDEEPPKASKTGATLSDREKAMLVLKIEGKYNSVDLKKAFRKQALVKHPDFFQNQGKDSAAMDEVHREFLKVKWAYDYLKKIHPL